MGLSRARPLSSSLQVCKRWHGLLWSKEGLATLWESLVIDFGHEVQSLLASQCLRGGCCSPGGALLSGRPC